MVMLLLQLFLLWTRDTSAEDSDRGNYTTFKIEVNEFFENKSSTLPIAFDEPSLRYIETKANIHKMNIQFALERDKLELEKLRFERESDVKTMGVSFQKKMLALEKLRFENDIEKLSLEKRRLENDIEKLSLEQRRFENDVEKLAVEKHRTTVFFATITLSAAILGGSLYVSTNGWQPAMQNIGSVLKSYVRWLYSPFRVKLFGDSEEMAKLSDVTSGKCNMKDDRLLLLIWNRSPRLLSPSASRGATEKVNLDKN